MTNNKPRLRSQRRVLCAAALSVSGALLVTACAAGGGAETASGVLPKEFSVLIQEMPATFDQFDTVAAPWGATSLVDEPLIRYDGRTFQPNLAKSFDVVSPTEYIYTLRNGVKFSDGTPMSAEDVKYSLEESMDQTHYSTTWTVMSSIKKITIQGENKIVVTLSAPQPQFQYVLAQTGIISKDFYEKYGDTVGTPDVGLLGTGPYVLSSFTPKKQAVLTPNTEYWGDQAAFQKITFTTVPDDSARLLSLQSGDANAAFELPLAQVSAVDAIKDFSTVEVPDSTLYTLQMDVTKKPFDDPKVRDAVRHAINREGIIEAGLAGRGSVAQTLTRASTLETVADKATVEKTLAGFDEQNAYDLDEAKRLIAQTSVAGGLKLELPIAPWDPNISLMAQTVAQDLAQIGIEVTLKPYADDYYPTVMGKHQSDGLNVLGFTTNTPDPAMPMGYFTPVDGVFNLTQLDLADATAKFQESNGLAVNDPERGRLILDALKIQQDGGAILPIAFPNMYFGLKAPMTLRGFTNYWWMARWDLEVTTR